MIIWAIKIISLHGTENLIRKNKKLEDFELKNAGSSFFIPKNGNENGRKMGKKMGRQRIIQKSQGYGTSRI